MDCLGHARHGVDDVRNFLRPFGNFAGNLPDSHRRAKPQRATDEDGRLARLSGYVGDGFADEAADFLDNGRGFFEEERQSLGIATEHGDVRSA